MLKRLILELLGVFIGIVALFVILAAVMSAVAKAGTEQVDVQPTVKVLVVSEPSPGKYYSRLGLVHKFTDAIIVVCFEWKNDEMAQCLVIVDDGDTLMLPVKLLEQKT